MKKILLPFIILLLLLNLPVNAQMHLKFNTQTPSDNLSYKHEALSSNLKLNLNTEAIASSNERLNKVRMMVMMNLIYALTFGDFGKIYSSAIGLELTYAYILSQQIMLVGSLGYLSWIHKNSLPAGIEESFSSFPFMIGLRYFFLKQMTVLLPYLTLQLGLHFLKQTTKYSFGSFSDEFSESQTKFGLNIGTGFLYCIAAALFIDFSIRYMLINGDPNSISNLGFHGGVSVPIN
jgi:opacity protein-like surface antigen